MSIKANAFSVGLSAPQTIDKFVVYIPYLVTAPLRVHSTTLPMKRRATTTVTIGGVSIPLPSKVQQDGTWSCTLTESVLSEVYANIVALQKVQFKDNDQNVLTKWKSIEPVIFILDEFTGDVPKFYCKLTGCWLESVSEPKIDWSKPDTPLEWTLNFKYSGIQDISDLGQVVDSLTAKVASLIKKVV